jgi:hypothetical protein
MRRDDGENQRLRALVEGSPIGSFGSDGSADGGSQDRRVDPDEAVSRS